MVALLVARLGHYPGAYYRHPRRRTRCGNHTLRLFLRSMLDLLDTEARRLPRHVAEECCTCAGRPCRGGTGMRGPGLYNVRHYWDWMHMPQTAAARQPSVDLDEFEEWQYLQLERVKKKEGGFTVDHWHVLRQQEPVGLVVAYFRSPDWKGPPQWLRRGAPLALVEDSPVAGPEPFSVRWKGLLRVPSNGDYTFTCMTEGACDLTLDGRKLFSLAPGAPPEGVTVTLPLASGPHTIEVLYAHPDPLLQPAFSLLWHPLLSSPSPFPIELFAPSKYALNP